MKLTSLILGIIIGGAIMYGFMVLNLAVGPTFEVESLYFPNVDETLYLKKNNWGITGDGQRMAISKDKNEKIESDSQDEYILEGLNQIFYQQNGDTLTLFVREKFIQPERFDSKIVIRQVELDNPDFQDLFDKVRRSIKLF